MSARRFLRPIPLIVLLVAAIAATWVRLPYYSQGPGPPQEVEPLIHVSGRAVYQSGGKLIMTTVEFRQLDAVGLFLAWLDPNRSVVSRDVLYPPGETQQEGNQRSISQMDTSKIDAASVVLKKTAGYPKDHGTGALIESVGPGCPAEGKLYAGDLVTTIDGAAVASASEARTLLDEVPTRDPITLLVRAAGEAHDITITRGACPGYEQPLIGISLIPNFPFSIQIRSGDVGGPSAGLMWSLGLYDLLTPGDLTGGRTIAGTGTIDPQGKVGPIGGIGDKVEAAQSAGAQVFLVPTDNLKGAESASNGSMKIVPVATFLNALRYLQGG